MKYVYISGPDKIQDKHLALMPPVKKAQVIREEKPVSTEWKRRNALVHLVEAAKPGDLIVAYSPRYIVKNLADLDSFLSALSLREIGLHLFSFDLELSTPEQIALYLRMQKIVSAVINDTKGAAISAAYSKQENTKRVPYKKRQDSFALFADDIKRLLKTNTVADTAKILGLNVTSLYSFLKKHPELLPKNQLRKTRSSILDKHRDELKTLLKSKPVTFIAAHFGLSRTALDHYLAKHPELKRPPRKQRSDKKK